ncbi:MAG: HAD family hydrolase [Vampirovibrionales bacterium]
MNLAPIMVRSQAVETPIFQRRTDRKRPILPQGPQRQGKLELPTLAIFADFDDTLTTVTMQNGRNNNGLLAQLGFKDPNGFWDRVAKREKRTGVGRIQAYMEELLHVEKKSKLRNVLTPANFHSLGQSIPMAPNVPFFMPRLQKLAQNGGLSLEFHILSSGIEEMIKGSTVEKYATSIRANQFQYNKNHKARGLQRVIAAHDKPTHIKEIVAERKLIIPPVYIGDGDTDIPAWQLVKNQLNGDAIAVYDPNKSKKVERAQRYMDEGLVSSIHPRNYQRGTSLMNHLGEIIETHAKAEESKPKLILLS